jgi:alcohol dehydrogenase YqhD (iron-dependent ADH family)
VSQNIAAVAAFFRGLPEPKTLEDHRVHHEVHTLLERAAVQQAESSLSRRHELDASQCASLG